MITIIETFDLVPKNYRKFWSSVKNPFDLVPKLKESFDLVFRSSAIRSSAIRSSDQLP